MRQTIVLLSDLDLVVAIISFQDVGLSDIAMTKMLALMTDFLDTFIQVSDVVQTILHF